MARPAKLANSPDQELHATLDQSQQFTATLQMPQLNAKLADMIPVPGPPGPQGPAGPPGPTGAQTPWTQDTDAAGFSLNNIQTIKGTLYGSAELAQYYFTDALNPGAVPWCAQNVNGSIEFTEPNIHHTVMTLDASGNLNITGEYRVNGAPLATGQNQSPWLTDIDAGHFDLTNLNGLWLSDPDTTAMSYVFNNQSGLLTLRRTDTWDTLFSVDGSGNIDISGQYKINGVPISAGGAGQTPWQSDIDAAGHNLLGAAGVYAQWYYGNVDTSWIYVTDPGISFMWGIGTSGGVLKFQRNSDWQTFVGMDGNTGNVGILTDSPAFTLDIAGDCNITGTYFVNGVPLSVGGAVSTVFGRSGAVVAQPGDYSAAQVTNAVDKTQSYANPTWITSLDWGKVTGAPSVGSYQSPWLQDIDAASHGINNVTTINLSQLNSSTWVIGANASFSGQISVPTLNASSLVKPAAIELYDGQSAPALHWWMNDIGGVLMFRPDTTFLQAFKLDATGNVDIKGAYKVNGSPLIPLAQTPWLQAIDANNFNLKTTGYVGIGNDCSILGTPGTGPRAIIGFNFSGTSAWGTLCLVTNRNLTNQQLGEIDFCNFAATGQSQSTDYVLAKIYSACDGSASTGLLIFSTRAAADTFARGRMWITSAGLVGINNSGPSTQLDVTGSFRATTTGMFGSLAAASAVQTLEVQGSGGNQMRLRGTDAGHNAVGVRLYGGKNATDMWILGADLLATGGTDLHFYNVALATVMFSVTSLGLGVGMNAPKCVIDSSGTIRSIGSSAPTGGAGIEMGYVAASNYGYLIAYDRTGSVQKLLALNPAGGNVGVGNSAPNYPLDVTGDVNFSAGVRLPGLPSTNPGAGSKKLWYDTTDGNRVKFAP